MLSNFCCLIKKAKKNKFLNFVLMTLSWSTASTFLLLNIIYIRRIYHNSYYASKAIFFAVDLSKNKIEI